jgi:hypothetical protein
MVSSIQAILDASPQDGTAIFVSGPVQVSSSLDSDPQPQEAASRQVLRSGQLQRYASPLAT